MIRKQDPQMLGNEATAVSTAPAKTLIDSIDAGFAALADEIAQLNTLMSQARSANVDAAATFMLQTAAEQMRAKVLSCQGDVAKIRDAHASVLQVNPMVPMGMGNDPMMAANTQQPPMNMPPGMMGSGM
jgi:hypothetical protein